MPCAECLIISDVRSLDEEDGEFMGTDAKVFCVFVRDRKSESVSDRLSTCCCSWQVEQAGLTQFDWCLSEWRPPTVSSFLVCWGFGSSLWTNPGRHTHKHKIEWSLPNWVVELSSKHAFIDSGGRSRRHVHSNIHTLQHSPKTCQTFLRLWHRLCTDMYSIHHLKERNTAPRSLPSTRG